MADTGQRATLTSISGIFVTSETAYEEFPEKMELLEAGDADRAMNATVVIARAPIVAGAHREGF